ncbi:hypothetical protein [Pseudoalteromonas sp.]|uniref:hypothetical protein n=1 Tax=Pseudoalteromonas sp. TaxID=53249 RepID=UPI0035196354
MNGNGSYSVVTQPQNIDTSFVFEYSGKLGVIGFLDENFVSANDAQFRTNPKVETKTKLEQSKKLSFSSKSNESKVQREESQKYTISLAQMLLNIISNSSYEVGILGQTEHELLNIYQNKYDLFEKVVARLWMLTYSSANDADHAHFLNALNNISEYLPEDTNNDFLTYAVSALKHKSVLIIETGIAMFERWDNPEHLKFLNVISEINIPWLDEYLEDVKSNLGE